MEHRRDVSSGALCGGTAQRLCGGVERTGGGAPLRAGPRDGAQDAALPACRPGIAGSSRSGVRSWTPSSGVIDQILHDDQPRPKKQRHTAKRIWERLRAEYAFTGGYTIVKDYVREKRLGGQEMFVPLTHPPGDAQADFGEALVVIDGVECKAHYLVVDLPHSDDAFVKACPAAKTLPPQRPDASARPATFRHSGQRPDGLVFLRLLVWFYSALDTYDRSGISLPATRRSRGTRIGTRCPARPTVPGLLP